MFVLALMLIGGRGFGADVVSHDEDYYTAETPSEKMIFTEQNRPFAEKVAAMEEPLHQRYQTVFGYVMDEKLYVGLISQKNQITNGFSTQIPNNRQINYMGGTTLVDYFSTRSWLETLVFHETAHNYQMNVKDNPVSKGLHSVLGNGFLMSPFFTIPNFAVHSFLLEGNAVLNESWHGNGGRLYSGRFLAQTLLQVKAGYFTPERMHNHTYFFPYGEHNYTFGGHLQYYLAENYGLEKTNSFFKINSREWVFPFFTNDTMRRAVGKDFETVMGDYVKSATKDATQLKELAVTPLVRSKFFSSLGNDGDEIFFIINRDGVSEPELVRYNRKSGDIVTERGGYPMTGRTIRSNGRYYVQGADNDNSFLIQQGLFDKNNRMKKGTESRVVQGYLKNGTPVYFDAPSSYDHPRLFVGDQFYADVHSAVFIDGEDNLYYFVQEDKTRTLYRNKTPIASLKGWYGLVSGVDSKGRVYVVSNSSVGSSLYRTTGKGDFERVLDADNVIEARLVSDQEVLVAATSADDYYYGVVPLKVSQEQPVERTLFFEKEPYYGSVLEQAKNNPKKLNLNHPYHSLTELNYSGTNVTLQSDSQAGTLYNVDVRFEDPLTQNAVIGSLWRDSNEVSLAGVTYENTQWFLRMNLNAFRVVDRDEFNSPEIGRKTGVRGELSVPLYQEGYWKADVASTYSQDYEASAREPLGGILSLANVRQYGISALPNDALRLDGFGTSDRGDGACGGDFLFEKGFPSEWYVSLDAKGSYSNRNSANTDERRGIKISRTRPAVLLDPAQIVMPSLKDSTYVKSVTKGSLGMHKVFNFSKYFFTFPVSLRREDVYVGYTRYSINDFNRSDTVGESVLGVNFDLLLLNSFSVPIRLEYFHNDNQRFGDKDTFRTSTSFAF